MSRIKKIKKNVLKKQKIGTKVSFRSNYTVKPHVSRGDTIDAYIYLQNSRETLLYVPRYKRILLGSTDKRCSEEIWRAITGWGGWEFPLDKENIKMIEKSLNIKG